MLFLTRPLRIFLPALLLLHASPAFSYEYKLSRNDLQLVKQINQNIKHDRYETAIAQTNTAEEKVIPTLIKWLAYRDNYTGSGFEEIVSFIEKHPGFPDQTLLRKKAELSLTGEEAANKVIEYFSKFAPLTGHGMLIYANKRIATEGDSASVKRFIKNSWQDGDFNKDDEDEFLRKYRTLLDEEDFFARADKLLWNGNISGAKRIYHSLSRDQKHIISARIKMVANDIHAYSKVPARLRHDPGLLYEKSRLYIKHQKFKSAYHVLYKIKNTMPHQHKWWRLKNRLIRELLDENKITEAYHIARNHGNIAGGADYAEAEWLAGWISLRFLVKPQTSYKHFTNMYEHVSTPISLARAAYWAGRSAETNKDNNTAISWFEKASQNPTTFYGQLAYFKINGKSAALPLPVKPEMGILPQNGDNIHELLMASYILEAMQQSNLAERFIRTAISSVDTPAEMAYISEFGLKVGRTNLAVIAAKGALSKGVVLTDQGWPETKYMPGKTNVEKPFALSIIRQESVFNPSARSSASAMGLMQLIPSTAKRVAKSIGVSYSQNKLLSDPRYNITLGSQYLGTLVDQWDGSYILAISSYNAGPGNAKKWTQRYKDPRELEDINDIIDWMESIPYGETRNYVQRVLENLQVYRSKLGIRSHTIIDDLMRGIRNKT